MRSLDIMLSDVDPVLQLCFEEGWDSIEDKQDTMQWLKEELKTYGIDDPLTNEIVEALGVHVHFDEVDYFNHLEKLFNEKGWYTYNSDTWFEVYSDDENTQQAIAESEEA